MRGAPFGFTKIFSKNVSYILDILLIVCYHNVTYI